MEFIRSGQIGGGVGIDGRQALCNAALYRCITLISQSIGMLPLKVLHNDDGRETATEHPVWKLLKRQPNKFQTAYEFKSLLQSHVLQYGNAYARIIRSRGQVIQLVPIHPMAVQVKQRDDWSVHYVVTRKDGGLLDFEADEILHLRDLTDDGLEGMSRVKLAKRALGIAFDAEDAASRIFSEGVMAGGYLATDKALSDKAYNQLQESLQKRYSGKANAGRFMILEEGLKAEKWGNTASDAQHIENRNHQIEEIARMFGVPRPLLMMDDTSWGSGISELGVFFLKYGLLPWFTMWEQALTRSLLNPAEQDRLIFKFNAGALLRGSLENQAEFFAKALGSGGHGAWMTQNEVREISDLPKSTDKSADTLRQAQQGKNNEPEKTTAD
ncbi:MAG: phage portal protein [Neisseria elongata]